MIQKLLIYLQWFEVESIYILCEVVVEVENLVMLYSVGKDSVVMLYLVKKVFYFVLLFFLLLYVDMMWKFCDMYVLCDKVVCDVGMELLVYQNFEVVECGINFFDYGVLYIDMWKIEGLKQVLDKYGFDVVFGGVCWDEEKLWVKECVFLFCLVNYCWDFKNQCLELWWLYNVCKFKGESVWVFLILNWIELDIW